MAAASVDVEELTGMDTGMDSNIALILLSPAAEMERGNIKASRISARIAAAIPTNCSEVVQLACAVEAIEKEDYQSWPSQWLIEGILSDMLQSIANLCTNDDLTQFQRSRYRELLDQPDLLQQITQGFTPILDLSDREHFVQTLIDAGAQKLKRGDEAEAINEYGVLHVALSYRHAHVDALEPSDRNGDGGSKNRAANQSRSTVSRETAEEAYQIIANLPKVQKTPRVRVWLDQNLDRYPGHGPWHERGFIPFAALIVVSPISACGGFSVGLQRPWLWVEANMALRANGIHCLAKICPSIRELVVYPDDARLQINNFDSIGQIVGEMASIDSCVRSVLNSVSWWTPNILEHAEYEHADEFRKFAMWARMQLIRMQGSETALDLNSRTCEDTMIEKIAWMKALPYVQTERQVERSPHFRIEGKLEPYKEDLRLLRLSGKTLDREGMTEVVGDSSGFEIFCFREDGDTVDFDVIPSRSSDHARQNDNERSVLTTQDLECFKNYRGGFSLWDARFPSGKQPTYVICNTIFDRHYGVYQRLGELGEEVSLGGVPFCSIGFRIFGMRIERVYESSGDSTTKRRLCESDVLCIQDLGSTGETKFISELMKDEALDSVSRIVKGQTGYPSRVRHPWAVGTSADKILDTLERIEMRERREELGGGKENAPNIDMITIRRSRLDDDLYMLSVNDEKYGQVMQTFQTSGVDEEMIGDLENFKMCEEDLMAFLTKIRLMMGSTEFDIYDTKTIRLGLCVGTVGKQAKPYETKFELGGSEFRLCHETNCVFSPVNNRVCSLATNYRTKEIRVEWLEPYVWSGESDEVDITGPVS